MLTFGGLSALASAFCYALASVFFRRLGKEVIPVGVTILKSAIACGFTLLVLLIIGDVDAWLGGLFSQDVQPSQFKWSLLTEHDFWMLFLSGLLGITIGDTAYFYTLNALGTRKTLILDTLSPSVTVTFAWLILDEVLSVNQLFGVLLTLLGVGWVMFERAGSKASKEHDQKKITAMGFTWGAINILSHSFAYITAKSALENVPSMEASLLRQGTAMLTLVLFCLIRRRLWSTLKPAFRRHNLRMLIGASTCGSFFGIWLGLLGIKLAPVSIASTLNTTTPLFILPINRIIEKQKITFHSVLGALIAVTGAAILLLSNA